MPTPTSNGRAYRAVCGIVGLFAKTPEIEERLGRAPLGDARADVRPRARQRRRRGLPRPGARRAGRSSRSTRPTGTSTGVSWPTSCATRSAACDEPQIRASHAVVSVGAEAGEAEAWIRANRPGVRVMSAGRVIEIYKEVGLPTAFARGVPPHRLPRHARASATRGWRRRAASRPRARTRSRPGSTSASSTTGRSRTTTGCARACAVRGSSSRPRTTPRSRPGTSPGACARARRCRRRSRAASTTSTASTPSSSARPTGSRCCATRSRASRPCSPRRDDWVAMASEWRAIAVLPGAADARMWEPEPGVVYAWEKEAVA